MMSTTCIKEDHLAGSESRQTDLHELQSCFCNQVIFHAYLYSRPIPVHHTISQVDKSHPVNWVSKTCLGHARPC